jgi:hypothetical protein
MERLAKRRVFTLPTLSVSVCLELNEREDCFQSVRIVAALWDLFRGERERRSLFDGSRSFTESIHRPPPSPGRG